MRSLLDDDLTFLFCHARVFAKLSTTLWIIFDYSLTAWWIPVDTGNSKIQFLSQKKKVQPGNMCPAKFKGSRVKVAITLSQKQSQTRDKGLSLIKIEWTKNWDNKRQQSEPEPERDEWYKTPLWYPVLHLATVCSLNTFLFSFVICIISGMLLLNLIYIYQDKIWLNT